MRIGLIALLSVVLFLLAAKTHGRHLRLERELAGHLHVTFGGNNPPWVEALWRAERWRFWGVTLSLALPLLVVLLVRRRDVGLAVIAMLLWAPTLSFLITGALSARRSWAAASNWGSVVWWSVCAVGALVLAWVVRRP